MRGREMSLLTVHEAAELVGVSRQTIYKWMDAGYLAFEYKGPVRLMKLDAVLSASRIMLSRPNGGTFRRGDFPK